MCMYVYAEYMRNTRFRTAPPRSVCAYMCVRVSQFMCVCLTLQLLNRGQCVRICVYLCLDSCVYITCICTSAADYERHPHSRNTYPRYVCAYMRVCVFISISVCECVYILNLFNSSMFVRTYVYVCLYMPVCMRLSTRFGQPPCVYAYMRVCVSRYMCVYVCVSICVRVYLYVC